MSTSLWLDKPCPCTACTSIRVCVDICMTTGDSSSDAAALNMLRNLRTLHRQHRPELYNSPLAINQNAQAAPLVSVQDNITLLPPSPVLTPKAPDPSMSSLQNGNAANTDQIITFSPMLPSLPNGCRKVLVCDHCRGHGLPCDESPVCQQCEFSETLCVHRWCEKSQHSIENCTDPTCHYAHEDYLPVPHPSFSREYYLILPGKLTVHLSKGKLEKFKGPALGEERSVLVQQAKQRQAAHIGMHRRLHIGIREGHGTVKTMGPRCGAKCRKVQSESVDGNRERVQETKTYAAVEPERTREDLRNNQEDVSPAVGSEQEPASGMQALKAARFLYWPDEEATYPDGFKSPDPQLKIRSQGRCYDMSFLLQFQNVFKEKPSMDWDQMINDTLGPTDESGSAHAGSCWPSRRPGVPAGMLAPMGITTVGMDDLRKLQNRGASNRGPRNHGPRNDGLPS